MSLPTWPGYLGDDTGLNSPRTESGRQGKGRGPVEEDREIDIIIYDYQASLCIMCLLVRKTLVMTVKPDCNIQTQGQRVFPNLHVEPKHVLNFYHQTEPEVNSHVIQKETHGFIVKCTDVKPCLVFLHSKNGK